MNRKEHRINRNLLNGWFFIVVVLLVAYFGEYLKGVRSLEYMVVFSFVTVVPLLVCYVIYRKNETSDKLRYLILGGYLIMYFFVLLTGSTTMVFTYIFPLLTLIVLYHHPVLVLQTFFVTLTANVIYVVKNYRQGLITLENSKDIEIQFALIFLCFGFLYTASKLYNSIHKQNLQYVEELNQKQRMLQHATLQTIMTIANIIDAKDECTKGHSQRVAAYASALAKELGYSEEEVRNVEYIALLHDIGKIGMPDDILSKSGKLNEQEYEIMKEHVVIGGEILNGNLMMEGLLEGVKYHHERYDGKGYPKGLSGKNIPIMGRIICIADAYDAMTSYRVYRHGLSEDEIIHELEINAGKQFDPELVQSFIVLVKEKKLEGVLPDADVCQENLGEQSIKLLQEVIAKQNAEKEKTSELDYLTSTYRRDIGEKKILEELEVHHGAIVLVDIKNLREVNHRLGIIGGDYLLESVAEILKGYREDGIVVRYAGDEFLCFIPAILVKEELDAELRELLVKLDDFLQQNKDYSNVEIYAGVVLSSQMGNNLERLIDAADQALYHVKQQEKARWYLYNDSMELN